MKSGGTALFTLDSVCAQQSRFIVSPHFPLCCLTSVQAVQHMVLETLFSWSLRSLMHPNLNKDLQINYGKICLANFISSPLVQQQVVDFFMMQTFCLKEFSMKPTGCVKCNNQFSAQTLSVKIFQNCDT